MAMGIKVLKAGGPALVVTVMLVLGNPAQAAALLIDFTDIATTSCGPPTGDATTQVSGGFSFSSDHLFVCTPGAPTEGFVASSGSTYLGTLGRNNFLGPFSLTMTGSAGISFDLAGFDVGEVQQFISVPTLIDVEGVLAGGGTVSASFTTDGAADGPAGVLDFESFGSSLAAFVGLSQVTFSAANAFGIDDVDLRDIVDSGSAAPGPLPAPTTLLLVGSSLLLLGASARRRA